MAHFTTEQLQQARNADLYEFLLTNHSELFKKEGTSIHPINNHSLSIKRGYHGYLDFATGDKGNSVDFLVRYLNYSLNDAVNALCRKEILINNVGSQQKEAIKGLPPVFPEPFDGIYKNLFAYLVKRGISRTTIQILIKQGLIYQECKHNNIVFINKERDWGEIRGTFDIGQKSFHGVVANCRANGFWWFQTSEATKRIYICEASIDAISLYELRMREDTDEQAVFISIGGATKQPAIDRIKKGAKAKGIKVILAVDNDKAGNVCREKNPDLEYLIPTNKDWNEDLLVTIKEAEIQA